MLGWDALEAPSARLSSYVAFGRRESGVWRVDRPGVSGEGFLLPAGESASFTLDLPADSALRLGVVPAGGGTEALPLVLRVLLDGQVVGEHRASTAAEGEAKPQVERLQFDLGSARRRGAELTLEAVGDFGFLTVIAPGVAPRQPPSRTEQRRPPDLVLFVADTMRADLLEAYRGAPGGPEQPLTPVLDAFVERSTVFERAFAVAPWTLPSHATMFTGLQPEQHRAVLGESRLPRSAVTLTEVLRGAGYRTAATTDGAFLGPSFGLDQGFEWFEFDQHPHDGRTDVFDLSVERARAHLAADDGRPLFLFVHTFRLHNPYVWTPEAEARLAPHGTLELTYEELWAEFSPTLVEVLAGGPEGKQREAWARRQMELMYWAGAIDFDTQMAAFLELLGQHGLGQDLHLVFTSDHGESFRKLLIHGHATGLEDDQTRIPLIVHSSRLAPGRRDAPVDLCDLAPTLAELAGVEYDTRGPGRSLLRTPLPRPILQHTSYVRPTLRGALVWPERFIFEEGGRTTVADLERDPGEEAPHEIVPGSGAELEARARDLANTTHVWQRRFALTPELAELDTAARNELRRLGYLGDDEPEPARDG
jgi:arylsulfatase A-like enzyme